MFKTIAYFITKMHCKIYSLNCEPMIVKQQSSINKISKNKYLNSSLKKEEL